MPESVYDWNITERDDPKGPFDFYIPNEIDLELNEEDEKLTKDIYDGYK